MRIFTIMKKATLSLWILAAGLSAAVAQSPVDEIAGKRVVFLGDSITQAGTYVGMSSYYLQRLFPKKNFDIYGLGLASETVSGLSEEGHAGGRFPRPCLFERLGRLLAKVKPEVVFACYGINCGIYQPLDPKRFQAFQEGVKRLVRDCREAGVARIFLITPPIYDTVAGKEEFNYDEVMAAYAKWERSIQDEAVTVIDLHTAMRRARDARETPFSKDRVHPGKEGHLLMARTILAGVGVALPDESVEEVLKDELFQKVDSLRRFRSKAWMNHIGYTRSKQIEPSGLGDTSTKVAEKQRQIDFLRRSR